MLFKLVITSLPRIKHPLISWLHSPSVVILDTKTIRHWWKKSKTTETDGKKYSMFLGWKNNYYGNDYTTKCNLQIQCNPYQITNSIFYRTRAATTTKNREIKETIPFTITLKKIKYLGINLPKEAEDLYSENYKTLVKEIEDNTNRWKDILCSWIRRINVGKMTVLLKAVFRFSAISVKVPMAFSTELE